MSCSAGLSGTVSGPSQIASSSAISSSVVWKYSSTSVQKCSEPPGRSVRSTSREERLPHHAPLLVPLLPPRIGKIDVDGRQRVVGQQLREQPQGVAVDHHGVGEAALGQAGGGELGVSCADLDAQEIVLRHGAPRCARKAPCPSRPRPPAAPGGRRAPRPSHGRGNWSNVLRWPDRSSDGSTLRSARRPMVRERGEGWGSGIRALGIGGFESVQGHYARRLRRRVGCWH